MSYRRRFVRSCMLFVVIISFLVRSEEVEAEEVEILRDPWGVPHIFARSDAGAFYGLGYASAADRCFQMTYLLRTIQGRLSEVIGEVKMVNRKETSIDHDRKMRTFGFYRGARRTAANLDPESKRLLAAYCRGVNDWFAENRADLPPLFDQLNVGHESWTPADCLASWWHIGQFFATDGTRDLMATRNRQRRFTPPDDIVRLPPDDAPAVVKRRDVDAAWLSRVEAYAEKQGLINSGAETVGPKFSHTWVVGKDKTTTQSAVLVSDPQTPVRNPSLFYEFHIKGATFNARGMGVAGSPILLIGFTDRVAWGMTALGADQADLFRIETAASHPNQYRLDGEWRDMDVFQERIEVKGGEGVDMTVRETEFGPLATPFCFARPDDGEVVLKRVPVCEPDRDTIQGAIAMIRAAGAEEFDAALEGWRFPSANVVFGDHRGNIGYRTIGALPLRSSGDESHGRKAMRLKRSADDWRGMIPHDVKPAVMNPRHGFLYSGNHRPIESWYPIPIGAMTGTGGDTVRSWRLRERLMAKGTFSPEEVLDIHYDMVNPARRSIVELAMHVARTTPEELSLDAISALEVLARWHHQGASMSLTQSGSAVAAELDTFFRFTTTELAFAYGGGESGLAYFLKTTARSIQENPQVPLEPRAIRFVEHSLASAWNRCLVKYGEDPSDWQRQARQAVTQLTLDYYAGLDRFPGLTEKHRINLPPLRDVDGGTIACQTSQSYTQWVPMHAPDEAMTILPIGQSERHDSKDRLSTMELWSEGKLHAAPLSRHRVESLGVDRTILTYP